MTPEEKFRRWLEKNPCPGTGRHWWCKSAVLAGIRCGLENDKAFVEALILENLKRNGGRDLAYRTEISECWTSPAGRSAGPPARSLRNVKFDPARLARAVKDVPPLTRANLAALSPYPVRNVRWCDFLDAIFAPGETVAIVVGRMDPNGNPYQPRKPLLYRPGQGVDAGTFELVERGSPAGVWYVNQPLSGKAVPVMTQRGYKPSWRSASCALDFRHLVLESDDADEALWLRFLARIKLPILAIYTSGRRSVHALCRLECRTKEAFDAYVGPRKERFKIIGGDPAGSLTAIRLTRLPGCLRGDAKQQLLYLNPQAKSPGLARPGQPEAITNTL